MCDARVHYVVEEANEIGNLQKNIGKERYFRSYKLNFISISLSLKNMDLILTEIKNKVGFITLNSEKTLNSLSFPMIEQLGTVLKMWELSDEVVCIFCRSRGESLLCRR